MDTNGASELEVAKAAVAVSREAVLKQQADVREFRVIAAALLTGTSVAVSFLGGRALDSGEQLALAVVGLVFFAASLVAIIRVLLPGLPLDRAKRLRELADGARLLSLQTTDDRAREVDVHERLAATYDAIYHHNDSHMRPLAVWLAIASVLLLLEVVAWGLSIGLARSNTDPSPRACVPATIARSPGCLARGQRCDRRYERAYERFGFVCTRRAGDGLARLR